MASWTPGILVLMEDLLSNEADYATSYILLENLLDILWIAIQLGWMDSVILLLIHFLIIHPDLDQWMNQLVNRNHGILETSL
jgi:hypothetical protein